MKVSACSLGLFILTFLVGTFGHSVIFTVPINEEKPALVAVSEAPKAISTHQNIVEYYPPSPDGAYFPIRDTLFERDTALVMNFSGGFVSGSIKIKDDFIESSLKMEESGTVRLKSRKIKGVHYVFKGRFLKDGLKTDFEDGETVLEGTLAKYRGSRRIYSIPSEYSFASEVCAWNENNR